MSPRFPEAEVTVALFDEEFDIIGKVRWALRQAGAFEEDISEFEVAIESCRSSDEIIEVARKWVHIEQ